VILDAPWGITKQLSKNIKINQRCQIRLGATPCSLVITLRWMPPKVALWPVTLLVKVVGDPGQDGLCRGRKKLHKCTAVIFSTVYLRFHYAIDIAAGVAFAGITLLLGSAILAWWVTGVLDRSGRSYISSPPRPLAPSA